MARLVYLGTPEAAVPPLVALVEAGHDVALVVSRADKRRGRGSTLTPSPVKQAAIDLGLPVTDRLDTAGEVGAELGVVVAYGRLVPASLLERLPMVNLHFSLLPRWRGAAPVERAVLAGDDETGVCLMALEEGLDTGPVYVTERLPLGDEEHVDDLRSRLVDLGSRILVDALAKGVEGLPPPVPQTGEPTYAEKIRPEELELHWDLPAEDLLSVVRLGRAWTTFRGKRLRVLQARAVRDAAVARPAADAVGGAAAQTGDRDPHALEPAAGADGSDRPPGHLDGADVATGAGRLELVVVQPEGKQPMPVGDWLRGARPAAVECLGT